MDESGLARSRCWRAALGSLSVAAAHARHFRLAPQLLWARCPCCVETFTVTPAERCDLHQLIGARHAELAILLGELKAPASVPEGAALAPASAQLESARLFEARQELRRFLMERAGRDSFLMRRSV